MLHSVATAQNPDYTRNSPPPLSQCAASFCTVRPMLHTFAHCVRQCLAGLARDGCIKAIDIAAMGHTLHAHHPMISLRFYTDTVERAAPVPASLQQSMLGPCVSTCPLIFCMPTQTQSSVLLLRLPGSKPGTAAPTLLHPGQARHPPRWPAHMPCSLLRHSAAPAQWPLQQRDTTTPERSALSLSALHYDKLHHMPHS
jgi:hypothetical protein